MSDSLKLNDFWHDIIMWWFFSGIGLFVIFGIIYIGKYDYLVCFSPRDTTFSTYMIFCNQFPRRVLAEGVIEIDGPDGLISIILQDNDNLSNYIGRIDQLSNVYPPDKYKKYIVVETGWKSCYSEYTETKISVDYYIAEYNKLFFNNPLNAWFIPITILWLIVRGPLLLKYMRRKKG